MTVFDQQGRQVAAVACGVMAAGRHEVRPGTKPLPAGMYLWKMAIDGRDAGNGKIVVGK